MKHLWMTFFALALIFCMLPLAGFAQAVYPDGIYRGFYYDGGIEQIQGVGADIFALLSVCHLHNFELIIFTLVPDA